MIFLETDRFYIRNIMEKDLDEIFDYRNNEICKKYQRYNTTDREDLYELIRRESNIKLSLDNPIILAIAKKENDIMVGEIVVMPNEDKIFMGYTISYKYHRTGIAFETLRNLIHFLHNKFKSTQFICLVEEGNIASVMLLEKLGYKKEEFDIETNSIVYKKVFE